MPGVTGVATRIKITSQIKTKTKQKKELHLFKTVTLDTYWYEQLPENVGVNEPEKEH